jgi:hypothetical protein
LKCLPDLKRCMSNSVSSEKVSEPEAFDFEEDFFAMM